MVNAILVGLDFAGKTSIKLYLENLDAERALITETSHKVERLERGKLNIYVIPGQESFRYDEVFYERLFPIADIIVFVVDASDKERFIEVKRYFEFVMKKREEYAPDARILILAHKQDLPNCAKAEEIAELLEVDKRTVLETSVKIPRTILHLLMTLHGIPPEPFLTIAMELKQETKAETVVLADGDVLPYAVVGDEDEAMRNLAALVRLMNDVGDYDVIYLFKGNLKTILIRESVGEDEIFFLVINSPEIPKIIANAIRKALKAAKEEYIRRWKK